MTLKSFHTAERQTPISAFADAEPLEFQIDEETFTAYPPTGAQLALAMAAQGSHSSMSDRMAGLMDFLAGILDDKGMERFRVRLQDRDDPFDMDTVEAVILWLTEEWAARPTQSGSGSRSSRRSSGRRLTATPPSVGATS